jgi:hypothetical protein
VPPVGVGVESYGEPVPQRPEVRERQLDRDPVPAPSLKVDERQHAVLGRVGDPFRLDRQVFPRRRELSKNRSTSAWPRYTGARSGKTPDR